MTDIPWDSSASLMRVTTFATAEASEELVARGTVHELVGSVLEMPADQQDDLLLRVATADDTYEYDGDTIRELAARPEFTGAAGAYDTAELPRDQLTPRSNPVPDLSGPSGTHPEATYKPEDQL